METSEIVELIETYPTDVQMILRSYMVPYTAQKDICTLFRCSDNELSDPKCCGRPLTVDVCLDEIQKSVRCIVKWFPQMKFLAIRRSLYKISLFCNILKELQHGKKKI